MVVDNKKTKCEKNSSKEMKIRNDFTFLGALNAFSNVNFSTRKQWVPLPCGSMWDNSGQELRIQN